MMDADRFAGRCSVSMVMVRLVRRLHPTFLLVLDPALNFQRWSRQCRFAHRSWNMAHPKPFVEDYDVDLEGRGD
jgi:hypothetical protein